MAGDDGAGDDAAGRPWWRRVAAWVTTALACVLVLFALIAPNQISHLTPGAFVRIPLEGLVGVALVLVLPARARRVVAALVGVVLGLLTLVKLFDMGFYETLDRPFDPVLDWILVADGVEFLIRSIGRAAAIGAVVVAVAIVVAMLIFMALSVLRLTRLAVRYHTRAVRTVAVLGVVWVSCAVLGVRIVPGVPVAADSAATLAYDRAAQVRTGLLDRQAFAAQAAVDAFRDTPGDKLLTGLRGKDVVFTFVESYGLVAVEDPELGPQVGAVLDAGNRRLRAAGYASRSAFLTSPTFGGGSWLAHSTLLSGLWIDNQQRYRNLLASDRLTLNTAFRRAGWRTVDVEPGISRVWPEGAFYGSNRLYTAQNLGYRGPLFNFSSIPDQYTLAAFQRAERAADHGPLMAEIVLLSSHAPWAPLPRLIDWGSVGDGSAFAGMPATGDSPDVVSRDRNRIRNAYRQSIEYSLSTLISYVETYGDNNLVLVFLGDHQPAPVVSGEGARRDVPITIVAHDQAVLDRISGWGWQDGLKPGPQAPVWRMDTFRDRFLTAFGPQVPR
ncbi:MAG: sulfatase [Actinobacteria bacterium 13_2_20CM_2_71_6]|nr:MAG: sulfatase [Actinobacteria bacterium 13_2_20CM_2_71_6]